MTASVKTTMITTNVWIEFALISLIQAYAHTCTITWSNKVEYYVMTLFTWWVVDYIQGERMLCILSINKLYTPYHAIGKIAANQSTIAIMHLKLCIVINIIIMTHTHVATHTWHNCTCTYTLTHTILHSHYITQPRTCTYYN